MAQAPNLVPCVAAGDVTRWRVSWRCKKRDSTPTYRIVRAEHFLSPFLALQNGSYVPRFRSGVHGSKYIVFYDRSASTNAARIQDGPAGYPHKWSAASTHHGLYDVKITRVGGGEEIRASTSQLDPIGVNDWYNLILTFGLFPGPPKGGSKMERLRTQHAPATTEAAAPARPRGRVGRNELRGLGINLDRERSRSGVSSRTRSRTQATRRSTRSRRPP